MTNEEKAEAVAKKIFEKLHEIKFPITGIQYWYNKDELFKDGTTGEALICSIDHNNGIQGSTEFFISDPNTLEILYVQTGPVNFVDANKFFEGFRDAYKERYENGKWQK
jgi:hypothetical protein